MNFILLSEKNNFDFESRACHARDAVKGRAGKNSTIC